MVNYIFKPIQKEKDPKKVNKDLRGAFITAINSFAENAFNNLSLEYLESNNILFIFKSIEIEALNSRFKEPLILYGLADKGRKDTDKFVRKFIEKIEPILQLFKTRYNNKDFTELSQFQPFKEEIREFIYI